MLLIIPIINSITIAASRSHAFGINGMEPKTRHKTAVIGGDGVIGAWSIAVMTDPDGCRRQRSCGCRENGLRIRQDSRAVKRTLTTPIKDEELESLNVGDVVYLTGRRKD